MKHYKDGGLVRRQRNDPLLDSKLAVEAFANQLDRLAGASPEPLTAWHWLTAGGKGDGFDLVLSTLREKTRSTLEECHASIIPAGPCCLIEECYRNFSTWGRYQPALIPALRPGPRQLHRPSHKPVF